MLFFRLLCGLLLYLPASAVQAAPALDTLNIHQGDTFPIHAYLYWMPSRDKLTAEQAYQRFQQGAGQKLAPAHSINKGFTDQQYWLCFSLKNVSGTEQYLFYKVNYPFIDQIKIYKREGGMFSPLLQSGAATPFQSRVYPYHDFVLPIRLAQDESSDFLMVMERRSGRFSTTPELVSASLFKAQEQRLYTIIGIICGIMFFNILINLFLGFSLRDPIHYRYTAYLIAALFWVFSSVGADYQFLFPTYPQVFDISQLIGAAITMVLMAQLALSFLDLKKNQVKGYHLLNIWTWLLVFALFCRIGLYAMSITQLLVDKIVSNLYMLAIVGQVVTMLWMAIVRIRQGFRPGWFYLAAICVLAISILWTSVVILISNDLSILISPPTSIQIGLIIESLIIFIGIIYRYSVFKKEKDELAIKLVDQKLSMSQDIILAQEEERRRIAQDLHDDLGATLSTLLLHITNQSPDQQDEQFNARSVAITRKALADLRNISHDLLPQDFSHMRLFQALKHRINELHTAATKFRLLTEGDDQRLSDSQSLTLYRIINELISNTLKHAKASHSNIDLLIEEDNLTLVFDDNGIGLIHHDTKKGIGIKNIRSRVAFLNGSMNIDHNRHGLTVIIVIPLTT